MVMIELTDEQARYVYELCNHASQPGVTLEEADSMIAEAMGTDVYQIQQVSWQVYDLLAEEIDDE
jgi:hypothetical protein